MDKLKELFSGDLVVANLGSGIFSDAIRAQEGRSFQVDWEVPCRGDEKLFAALEDLSGGVGSGPVGDGAVVNENPMFGTNEMLVDGSRFLLAGGDKTHVVASGSEGDELRPAVDGWRCDSVSDWQQSYALESLKIER